MRFSVEKDVFEQLGDSCFGIVLATGIANAGQNLDVAGFLDESITAATRLLADADIREHESVKRYREAFRFLGINPNKYMCSIEALLTRISKGKGLPRINTAVDLANAISLRHLLPIGAHDADTLNDELSVRHSISGDSFTPFGGDLLEAPLKGEIVYASGRSIRTRRWIWRQSELGKITPGTSNIVFTIDGFSSDGGDLSIQAAQEDLAQALRLFLGCQVSTGWVDALRPVAEFPYACAR